MNRLARLTEQTLKVKNILESVGKPLGQASRQVSYGGYGSRGLDTEESKNEVAKQLAHASAEALKELRLEFEDPRRQEAAKHYLTRVKNLTKMIGEYVHADTWAKLEPVLKKQQTKSKAAHEKFFEYAQEVEGLVAYFDTEHEDTIRVGPWTVSLFTSKKADWDQAKVAKLQHVLLQTTRILKSVGVGGAAGGHVSAYPTETLPGAATSHGAIASYKISEDTMALSAEGNVNEVLHSLVHESGHRVYYRILDGNARTEWKAFFEAESGPPDVDTIIKTWEAYANKPDDWEAQKYGRFSPYFARELRKNDPDMLMWVSMIFDYAMPKDQKEEFDKYTGSPKKGTKPGLDVLIENKGKIKTFLHPVTAYSGKDAEELFAEVFAAYAIDGPGRVPEIVMAVFKRVLPQARTAELVAARFEAAMQQTAVIRKEKGQYCVRSPNNPDWNGGCYDSKGEAEKRLSEVEYFKHKGSEMNPAERVAAAFLVRRQAGEIKTVWVVRDWNNRIEYLRELVWPEPVDQLVNYIRGAGRSWEEENTKLFTDEASALKDFERRMKAVDAAHLKKGLYRHMHGDGRIIYVSIPDSPR